MKRTNKSDVANLRKNGIFLSNHSREKMRDEHVTIENVKEVLENGEPKPDNSTRNDKSFAWNSKLHYTLTHKNLTVVLCESKEKGLLICSVYHGLPHAITSNPFNNRGRLNFGFTP